MEGSPENKPKFISLQEASTLCEYSYDYLRLRANQGKLRAQKIGSQWVTTPEWLREYVTSYSSYRNGNGNETGDAPRLSYHTGHTGDPPFELQKVIPPPDAKTSIPSRQFRLHPLVRGFLGAVFVSLVFAGGVLAFEKGSFGNILETEAARVSNRILVPVENLALSVSDALPASFVSDLNETGSFVRANTEGILGPVSSIVSGVLSHIPFFDDARSLASRFVLVPYGLFTDSLEFFADILGIEVNQFQDILEDSYIKAIQVLVPGYQPPSYALKLAPKVLPRLQNLERVITQERIIREQGPEGARLVEKIQEVEKITEVTKVEERIELADLGRIDRDLGDLNQDLSSLNTSIASLNLKILNLGIIPTSPIPPSPAPSLPSSAFAINNVLVDQITPNIVSSVDGVVNDGGNVDLVSGSANLTIASDDAANTVTFNIVGTGLNADLLDSLDSADFLRSNATGTFSAGTLSIGSGARLGVAGTLFFDLANDVTLSVTNPASTRTYTIPDFGLNDSFVGISGTQTLQNKTLATGTLLSTTLDAQDNLITNIGNAGTDFTSSGGLTLAGLFVSNATSTINANFAVLGTTSTDSDFIYFDSTTTEWFSWDDTNSEFDLSDDFNISGTLSILGASGSDSDFIYFDATTTEFLEWREASSTFAFSDDLDMSSFLITDIGAAGTDFTSSGGLTLAGLFVSNATSTINANFAVLGVNATDSDFIYFDATTTEFLEWRDASSTFALSDDLDLTGALVANATSTIAATLAVVGASGSDSDFLYFDTGTSEYLSWNDSTGSFDLSDDLNLGGFLLTNIGNANTNFISGGGLTLAGALTVNNTLAVLGTTSTDSDFLYFDTGTSESLSWDDASSTFVFSDDLTIQGNVIQRASSPTVKGSIQDTTNLADAEAVWVQGNYSYVIADGSAGQGRLTIIDVSDPACPGRATDTAACGLQTITGTVSSTQLNDPQEIVVVGRYAYITSYADDRLVVVDVSTTSAPVIAGSLQRSIELNGAAGLYVSGAYAFVTSDLNDGLVVVDISMPTSPRYVNAATDTTLLDQAIDVVVQSKYAYVVTNRTGNCGADGGYLTIIDVSDPEDTLPIVGNIHPTGACSFDDIDISGRYAYVVSSDTSGIFIIDVATSTAPSAIATFDTFGFVDYIDVAGDYAYITNFSGVSGDGLLVFNISNPRTVSLAGTELQDATNLDTPKNLYVSGKYAYIAAAGTSDRLTIVELTGADLPVLSAGSINTSQLDVSSNLVVGNELYVGSGIHVGAAEDAGGISANFGGFVSINGGLAVGSGAPSAGIILALAKTFDSSLTCAFGCYGILLDPTSNASVNHSFIQGITIRPTIGGSGTGTVTNYRGIRIQDIGGPATATVTNNYGIDILNQTRGTNDYGIYIAGADTYSIWVDAGVTRLDGNLEANLSAATSSTEAVCGTNTTENSTLSTIDDCTTSVNADYAEMYSVEHDTSYGHIVSLGDGYITTEVSDLAPVSRRFRKLVKSSPSHTRILGIVSDNYSDFTSTGYTIREEDNPMPVALVGRVPTFVSIENGHIEPGDAITFSSIPGYGAKATRTGQPIVGIAIESTSALSLENASIGTIMVFVNPGMYIEPGEFYGESSYLANSTSPNNPVASSLDLFSTFLAEIRGTIENGVLKLKEVVVEKLTAKKARIEKLEMIDSITGETYCIWIENGEWVKQESFCD